VRRLRVAVVVALGILVASAAFAQQGSINGTAVDATRAVLPGVNITATDQEAGRQITAVTNEKGEYLLEYEVQKNIGDDRVIAGAMETTDGLSREDAARTSALPGLHTRALLGLIAS